MNLNLQSFLVTIRVHKVALFKRWWIKEGIFLLAITILLYLFSYAPIAINYRNAPKGLYYWGTTNYPLDTLGNLDTVREGYLGHLFRSSKVTTTIETKPMFVKSEYIFIGHLARITGSDPLFMFYLTRIFLSLALLIFIYFLTRKIFSSSAERIAAYFLTLFGTSTVFSFAQGMQILSNIPEEAYTFFRLTLSPHHYLLGMLFSLASLYFLSKALDKDKSIVFLFSATVSGMIAGFVYAPAIILVTLGIPVFLLIMIWKSPREKRYKMIINQIGKIAVFGFGVAIPLIYMRYVSQFWDFNSMAYTEKIVPFNPTIWQYFYIVGITYFLSIVAVPFILKTGNTLLYMFIPWIIVHPLAVNFIAPVLGISKGRFFLTPYFIVFAIMSVFGIKVIGKNVIKFFRIKYGKEAFLGLSVFVVFLSGIAAYKVSLEKQVVCFCLADNFAFAYPKKAEIEAINWFRDKTAENDIILSGPFMGTIIPAFGGNRVYTSWWFYLTSPPNFPKTLELWLRFYKEEMGNKEAYAFLKDNKIAYVYLGTEERNNRQNLKNPYFTYPFLSKRFENGTVTIYGVDK